MICVLKQRECRVAELFAERFQQLQLRKLVASSLQEQQRNLHIQKVLRAGIRRLAGRMKRESKKHQPAHAGQRRRGLRLRSHPATKRFATREKRSEERRVGKECR